MLNFPLQTRMMIKFAYKYYRVISKALWITAAFEIIILFYLVVDTSNIAPFWGSVIGTFLGAFVILGIERFLEFYIKFFPTKKQVSKALEEELEENLKLCEFIISSLAKVHHSWWQYTKFHLIWLEKFVDDYVNFRNEDSVRLYKYFYDARSLIEQIEFLQVTAIAIHTSARGHQSFSELAATNNKKVLKLTRELKLVLSAIKILRKGDKIFKEDVYVLFGAPTD